MFIGFRIRHVYWVADPACLLGCLATARRQATRVEIIRPVLNAELLQPFTAENNILSSLTKDIKYNYIVQRNAENVGECCKAQCVCVEQRNSAIQKLPVII